MISRKFAIASIAAAALMLGMSVAQTVAAAPQEPPVFSQAWGDKDLAADVLEAEFDQALQRAGETAPVIQLAHAGQLSSKDDCHRHKAAGERHWHKDGTSERGGPCVKVHGESYRLGENAICAKQRVAIVNDDKYDDWVKRETAKALVKCVQGLEAPPKR